MTILRLQHRQRTGEQARRNGQVAIGRQAEIIGQGDFKPVDRVIAQLGREQAAGIAVADRMRKYWQRQAGDAEQRHARAGIADALRRRIIDDADRSNFPRRFLGAIARIDHGARGIGRAIDPDHAAGLTRPALCRDAPALLQHDEHILDHAVLQRIGQLDPVAIGGVAFGIGHRDIAVRHDLPGLAVPHHLVGAQPVALTEQAHIAADRHDIAVRIIFGEVGGKLDLVGIVGKRGFGRRRRFDRAVLQVLNAGRTGPWDQTQGQRDDPGEQQSLARHVP